MARKKKVEEHVDLDALVQGLPTTDEVHEAHARSRTNLWRDPQFVAEHLKIRFVHDVRAALDRLGWSQGELARRIGKSPQYVSRVLDEEKGENFTIETMAAFACELGLKLEIQATDESARQPQPQVAADRHRHDLWLPVKSATAGRKPASVAYCFSASSDSERGVAARGEYVGDDEAGKISAEVIDVADCAA